MVAIMEEPGFSLPPGPSEVGNRYRLLMRLGRGGFGTVFLARDRLGGRVALKQLHPGRYSRSALELAHEFEVLASLRHPNIISVLDYGFDEHQRAYLVFELLEDAQTLTEAGWEQPRSFQVELLSQMLQALVYLHRRGIIHRDIKPANVLVVDGQVKLLDFGLAVALEQRARALRSGTRGYLAPELLRGEPPSELSDLYAVGVLAYEIFVGRHPEERRRVSSVAGDVAWFAERFLSVESPEAHAMNALETLELPETLEPGLARLLRRLLALEPQERFQSAEAALAALCEATGQALPVETVATRESFLQAARFIGRRQELARLGQALDRAEWEEQGSAWLVAGESGVGKSRLLAEFRILALVRGATVLRGQAIRQGGSPYQAWREVLRGLALLAGLEAQEAAIFKPLVPDIGTLLGRDIPEPEPLGVDAAHLRLLATVEEVLGRLSRPMVVILEDLQWADSATLSLLSRLARSASRAKLLLLGSNRDDERPRLAEELPALQVLKLPRLTPTEIAALSESMVGRGGREPRVVSLLERETEGNPFFLIEVIRALAERSGRLDWIGRQALPGKAFVGGMRSIIQRRLGKVPLWARERLRLAAIIGRDIHVELLRADDPSLELTSWLQECADAAVLEVAGSRWRFAHDKLREGLLESLSPELTRALHRRAAEAIESVYGDSADWVAALAHHWAEAGEEARAAVYSEKAGQQALSVYACGLAVEHFQRALAFAESRQQGHQRIGHLEARVAETYFLAGDLEACRGYAERALAHFGWPVPRSRTGWALGIPWQVAELLLQSAMPQAFAAKSREDGPLRREAGQLMLRLSEILFYVQNSTQLLWSGLRTLNVLAPGGPSESLARGYVLMAAMLSSLPPLRPVVESWCQRALKMSERLGTPADIVYTLARCAVCGLGYARWTEVEAWTRRALQLADATRDFRQAEEVRTLMSLVAQYQGRFQQGLLLADAMEASARRRGSVQTLHWGALSRAGALVRLGRTQDVIRELDGELPWVEAHAGASEQVILHGALALSLQRQGQESRALEVARRGLALMRGMRPVAYWLYTGVTQVAEVYLTAWERRGGGKAPRAEVSAARDACKAMRAFGRAFAFGKPFALLCTGLEAWLLGRTEAAHRAWQACVEHAVALGLPYEEGRARLELGRHLAREVPARREHLLRARDLFARLQAADDLARAEAELAR